MSHYMRNIITDKYCDARFSLHVEYIIIHFTILIFLEVYPTQNDLTFHVFEEKTHYYLNQYLGD